MCGHMYTLHRAIIPILTARLDWLAVCVAHAVYGGVTRNPPSWGVGRWNSPCAASFSVRAVFVFVSVRSCDPCRAFFTLSVGWVGGEDSRRGESEGERKVEEGGW